MQYTYQQVFDEYTTQKAMFDVVAMSLVEDVLRGKNGQIIEFILSFNIITCIASWSGVLDCVWSFNSAR